MAINNYIDLPESGVSVDTTTAIVTPNSNTFLFDEFVTGLLNVNLPISTLGWGTISTGGGGILGANIGSIPAGIPGRIGFLSMSTGTTNNATGQAVIALQSAEMYCGQAGYVLQAAVQIPATLSTAGVEYVIEFGIGLYPFAPSANGCVIQYNRTTSTNWSAYTSNNGTATSVTTADATDFAVVAGAWYNLMIIMNPAGTIVSFYVAKMGAPYVLLGTSTTNLPDVNNQAYPYFQISKASATTTARVSSIDWFQMNVNSLVR